MSAPRPAHVERPSGDSLWTPIGFPSFRRVWSGMLVVNLATMMQVAAAAWLMVSLTSSPLLVGMIQTASMLPSVLFSVPGRVLADLVDRRRLLLIVQVWMLATTLAAALFTYLALIGPVSLLLFTAALGLGFALQMPAWYTSLTESVPRPHLPAAVSLSSIAFNAAHAAGPAIAGAVVVASGVATVFALCALGFIGAMAALIGWKGRHRVSTLPPERLLSGLRGALRYARHSGVMRLQLLRTALFVAAASGLWDPGRRCHHWSARDAGAETHGELHRHGGSGLGPLCRGARRHEPDRAAGRRRRSTARRRRCMDRGGQHADHRDTDLGSRLGACSGDVRIHARFPGIDGARWHRVGCRGVLCGDSARAPGERAGDARSGRRHAASSCEARRGV